VSQEKANEIKTEFERLTGIEVSATFMPEGEGHIPTTLPIGKSGVYVFLAGSFCCKVGKAGAKSKARWNSHHYNLDETTPSTLPKSILKNKEKFKKCYPVTKHQEIEMLGKNNIQMWIRNNMSRMEFLIPDNGDPTILNLLEALAQFYTKPLFEGRGEARL